MREKIQDMWYTFLVPILIGLIIFAFYGFQWSEFYNMMSITFFIMFPYLLGVISIMAADVEKIKRVRYRLFHPWKILGIILLITMAFAWEGWACWIMLVPFLAFFSSLGGYVAADYKLRQNKRKSSLNVTLVFLIPLIISPLESYLEYEPKIVETQTEIQINANPTDIWNNITNVYKIEKEEDTSTLTHILGFPRPVEATLDKLAVGGYRKAMFTDGLIFHERVIEYTDEKRMFFSIDANSHDIPSTTFDNHLLIGGDYFDMLNGEYRLVKINDRNYKVVLTSHFKVSTSFNWYAGLLGTMIMSDIQENILNIVKQRSEKSL